MLKVNHKLHALILTNDFSVIESIKYEMNLNEFIRKND